MEILTHSGKLLSFVEQLRTGAKGVLLCDFDGTLAPFHDDPGNARPHQWVPGVLGDIAAQGTRVAIVTGRAADDLRRLLDLNMVEVWGSHGRERIWPDGRRWRYEPDPELERVLDRIEQELRRLAPDKRFERKVGCLAVHWRGLPDCDIEWLRSTAQRLRQEFDRQGALIVKPFQMGIEFQTPGPNKGTVVSTALDEERGRNVAACYMGDDQTDEDAFQALGERGLSILVSPVSKITFADVRLETENEVRGFLERWRDAVRGDFNHGK